MSAVSVIAVSPLPRRAPSRPAGDGCFIEAGEAPPCSREVFDHSRPAEPIRRVAPRWAAVSGDDRAERVSPSDGVMTSRPGPDPDAVARRALDVARRTALGVLAGDVATADDVAQEVAILAVRDAHRLRDPLALDRWLYRTTVRAALRTVRRGRRRHEVEQHHAAVHARDNGETPTPIDDLGRLLSPLPERQRAALTLRYAHDLDDDEIAAALGCRTGTVRALLSRGRAALRAQWSTPASADTSHRPTSSGADHA